MTDVTRPYDFFSCVVLGVSDVLLLGFSGVWCIVFGVSNALLLALVSSQGQRVRNTKYDTRTLCFFDQLINSRQIPAQAVVIQSVADNELIFNIETYVFHRNGKFHGVGFS